MAVYDPNTRWAMGPSGYWIPVSSGGRPLSDFVLIANPNGQGERFLPRDELPSDWQPGMSVLRNPDGSFRAVPFQTSGNVGPYYYHDFASGPPPEQSPPPPGEPGAGDGGLGGLLGPGGSSGGGLPVGQPGGGSGGSTGGGPISQPNPGSGPVSMPNLPPIGAGTAREEIERLRLAGLLDNLSINTPQGVRAPDYGNGPGVPMTQPNGPTAVYGYRQNNYFGTWDPTLLQGGSNPYYNPLLGGNGSIPPPSQGPVIIGPNGLPMGLLG